jgi:uncharacterized protein
MPGDTDRRSTLSALKQQIAGIQKRTWKSRKLVALLRQAAHRGDADAMNDLGALLRDGLTDRHGRTIVKRDVQGSIRYFRRAAELGDRYAMEALATALASGREGPGKIATPAVAEALQWYRKAMRLGGDCFNLAVTYQNCGEYRKAVAWFRRSASEGSLEALLSLARAELYGVGTRRNVAGGMAKLRRVALAKWKAPVCQLDREAAMLLLAEALQHGWLAPRDYRGSLTWLRRAAKVGSAAASGLLRDLGEGGA